MKLPTYNIKVTLSDPNDPETSYIVCLLMKFQETKS